MKRIYYSSIILLLSANIFAQVPQSFNYQAVVRDTENNFIPNQAIGVQISILQDSVNGSIVYMESHLPITTDLGLININIGKGETTYDFTAISWETGIYFMKVEIDPDGGSSYTEIGITQLLSVPYSLYSEYALKGDSSNTNELQDLTSVLSLGNDAGGNLISNLASPINDSDAINKQHLEQRINEMYNQFIQDFLECIDYDGNSYEVVRIGNQIWMAENLKSIHYTDGTPITGVYAFNNDENNVEDYGRLYTWTAMMNGMSSSSSNPSGIQGVCPDKWHLPSDAELMQLIDTLGGMSLAGAELKELGLAHWYNPNTGATNLSGFTALPGGFRSTDGTYTGLGYNAFIWSCTEYSGSPNAWYYRMDYDDIEVTRSIFDKLGSFSVRCIRD